MLPRLRAAIERLSNPQKDALAATGLGGTGWAGRRPAGAWRQLGRHRAGSPGWTPRSRRRSRLAA
jgi:hypothetical protein